MTKEEIYDEQIAPLLLQAGKLALENGMSIVATVEYGPGDMGTTVNITKDASLPVRWMHMAAMSSGNLDGLVFGILRQAGELGIDTSASIIARQLGEVAHG